MKPSAPVTSVFMFLISTFKTKQILRTNSNQVDHKRNHLMTKMEAYNKKNKSTITPTASQSTALWQASKAFAYAALECSRRYRLRANLSNSGRNIGLLYQFRHRLSKLLNIKGVTKRASFRFSRAPLVPDTAKLTIGSPNNMLSLKTLIILRPRMSARAK